MANLLRFISRDLPVGTHVETVDGDTFVVLSCEGIEIGRRRLNKRTSCQAMGPWIGPIPIAKAHANSLAFPRSFTVQSASTKLNRLVAPTPAPSDSKRVAWV